MTVNLEQEIKYGDDFDPDDPDEEMLLLQPFETSDDVVTYAEEERAKGQEVSRKAWLEQITHSGEAATICGTWRCRSDPARRKVKIVSLGS